MNDNELKKYTADLDFKIKQEYYKCIHEQNKKDLIVEGVLVGTVVGTVIAYTAAMMYSTKH